MIKCEGHSYVSTDAEEYFGPEVHIGNFSGVADKVVFCGQVNHVCIKHKEAVAIFPFTALWNLPYYEVITGRGPINIGNDVWIGRGAFILDGVTIGDGAIIGAMAVVAKDVPPYAVAVGNPAEVKHFRFTPEQIEMLLKIKWWNWSDDQIKERIQDFKDIKVFLEKYAV